MGRRQRSSKNQGNSKIQNAATTPVIQNGLQEALLGFNFIGESTQLSQPSTLFKNARFSLVSNFRQMLSQVYVEYGLVQTIVDIPIDDGLRGGVEIQSEQLDEDEINLLNRKMERENDLKQVGQALKWNRLYGGAGIIIITNENPQTPFDIDRVEKNDPLEFKAVDMWELYGDRQNMPDADAYSRGDMLDGESEFFSYYGRKIHHSRVMILKGLEPPSFVRPRLRGWGFSVVEPLVRSINQYLKATDLSFEVLDEFKLDIFKINGLANTLLDPQGEAVVQRRVAIANQQKNYQNALTMDGEDDYQQKQLNFSGLAEVMQGIRLQVASDMRMPLTKLFGISSAGFSSGEDDIENYNAMIESQVRTKSKWDIVKIIEIRCQQLFGFIPDDLGVDFVPLRVLSSEQEENVKTQKFNRVLAARQSGEITSQEFIECCNRDDLLPVRLDPDGREVSDKLDPEEGGEPEPESVPAPPAKTKLKTPEPKA